MKIVHVILSIDPSDGGLQAVALRMAAAQSAYDTSVHIVSYGSTEALGRLQQVGRTVPGFEAINWHIMPQPNRVESVLCLEGRKILTQVLKSASFVHIHGVWDPLLKHAATQAAKARIPYCISPAGMLDRWSLEQKAWKKRLALRLGYRRMLNEAHFIQALNIDESDVLKPLELEVPSLIVPNGVFVEEFDPLPEKGSFLRAMSLPADRRYILFLSRLHFKKGLDVLAKAFREVAALHPDVDLVVAGPPGGAEDEFGDLIRQFGLETRVHLAGPLYGDLKIQALVDAECFCLPSRQEGFSMAITEALASGTPVVITDACHFPEVAEAEAGIIVPLDPHAVAMGLAEILSDRHRAEKMGQNGRRLVMDTFTWPAIAEMTLRNYRLTA